MDKKNITYIVGHRNPDTDSICSAIAYADIKNRTSDETYLPMRAGQINEETEFVLKYFRVDTPGYLPDAATQVEEIDIHQVPGVAKDISVKNAWNTMGELNVVTLPVTDENNRLEGIINVRDIVQSYMDVYDNDVLSKAKTKYRSIAETLDGEILVGDAEGVFDEGRVVIGAFDTDMMGNIIREKDLVIVGNRAEVQLCCLDANVSAMVVGLGAKVSASILKLANQNGTVIISSPHDTYTIARMINQAIPIDHLMVKENLMTFKLKDKISEVEEIMKNSRHRDYPILDKHRKYVGTISRRNLIGRHGKKIILVDHNEKSQAPLNIEEAEIMEIIDHHRLGAIQTVGPVLFRNQPVGCTATIIYQIYFEKGICIPDNIAGLLCAAIISDTLLFRSPTCTPMDVAAAEALAKFAGIEDLQAFATEMFRAGSNLKDKSADEIFFQDFKKFIIEKERFGVGQISSMDAEELQLIKDKLVPHLEMECGRQGVSMVFFMLTSILEESTELLFFGKGAKELVESAFQIEAGEQSAILKGVVSRKKQLIPSFMLALQQQ